MHFGNRQDFRRLALLGTAMAAISSPAFAQATKSFDIPAQPLGAALEAFGRQSGAAVMFDQGQVAGRTSTAVRGTYMPSDALARLLSRSGFSLQQANGNTFVVNARPPVEAATPAVAAEPPATLGELIVTAQKRQERLIDVPQSASVLSAASLQRQGATQFRDYADTIAGLTYRSSGAGATQIALRGITAGNFDIGPTVAVYVDEVPFGSSTIFANGAQYALDVALADVDQIEVLRGPQGTLYGANAMGGILKYVSRRPDLDEVSVRTLGGLSTTRHGGLSYDASISLNAPLVEGAAAVKANAFYNRDGGYIDNTFSGDDNVNRSRIYGGRLDFFAQPTDRLTLRLGAFAQNIRRDGTAYADYTLSGEPVTSSLEQSGPFDESFKQRFRLASATITYDLDGAVLTSVSSYQTIRTTNIVDFSRLLPFTNAPVSAGGLGRSYSAVGLPQFIETDKLTQELRAQSDGATVLDWVVGGYYTHEDSTRQLDFAPLDAAGQPAPNDLLSGHIPSTYEEVAAFANLTWKLTPAFDVSGGVRYAHNRQSFTQNGSGMFLGSFPKAKSSEGVFTYLANARYRFSEHATAYLRYATSYRPGGPNYIVNDPATGQPIAPPTFEADTLENFEVGLHAETSDRRFGIDAAAYHIIWDNIQIAAIRGGLDSIVNIPGGATVNGAELTLTARPSSAFTASGALAYQDATLSETDADIGAQKGDRLAAVPKFTATLTADYVWFDHDLQPSVGATLRYVSDRPAEFGAGAYKLPDYATLDLRAGVRLNQVDVTVLVKNLFDERQQLTGERAGAIERVAIGQPRTFGVRVSSAF